MKVKGLLKGAAICAFASTLVACGNGGGSASKGAVELEYFSQKAEMQSTLKEIVKDFEKANPDIKIKLTNVPDAGTVLKTRMANNEDPDIINVYPQNMDFQEWAKDGQFLELDDKSGLENLKDGAAETYALNDKIYSLPLTANAYGFYYNKNKFKELGLEVPKTFDEFKEIVDTINKDGKASPFALSLNDPWSLNGYHQLAWATNAGGYDGAEEKLIRSGKGAIMADDAITVKVNKALELLHGNGQKGYEGAKYTDTVAKFAKGEALMMPQGTWAAPVINQQKPDFEVGMFPYPGQKAGEELTVGAADLALSISKDSKHPNEAKKFLDFMSSKKAIQKYYDVDGSPTSVDGVDTEGKFKETEGVTKYAFTDKHIVWLQNEWQSEEEFWNITVKDIKKPDAKELAKSLNKFFDSMKK